ncbi:MAG: glutathione S-transferase family protein [Gammaproteobacteria bacterium]|nr:glutathione S-transferase family protein [Gammaproteobacteria bacterium]
MTLKLVSFVLCPFVQRAVITLREKQVDFSIEYIDLSAPPEWFRVISPLGKVPVLQVDGEVIFESSVIIDYLDEVFAPRLHPKDPLKRAQHKAWIEYGSGLLMDQHAMSAAQDEADYLQKSAVFRRNLSRLASPIGSGLFAEKGGFSMVDAAYAPLFTRMDILGDLGHVPSEADVPEAVSEWGKRLLQRPSVADSVVAGFELEYIDYFIEKKSWLLQRIKASR